MTAVSSIKQSLTPVNTDRFWIRYGYGRKVVTAFGNVQGDKPHG
jgi:hypothetical protein